MLGVKNEQLQDKLKDLPASPGVYTYKNAGGQIIYIGKAAVLRNRVRQYFQKSRARDAKTDALVAEIADVEWITVDSEIDALFLEAELVRRYMPQYNILLRDDKSTSYVRIDIKSDHPTVTLTRRPLDDGAEYFGPYFAAGSVKKALHYLRRAFPYSTHNRSVPKRACLQYQLGLCPGLEEGKADLEEYRANLRKLISYLKGNRVELIKQIEKEMKIASKNSQFEKAAELRNQLFALKNLSKQIIFSSEEFLDISKDKALAELSGIVGVEKLRRIEGYDISHMSGTDTVASMVVFVNGLPAKTEYKKFKMRVPGNDDFAHMREVITRRLSPRNYKSWDKPDLILIDGGKGQLSSAIAARDAMDVKKTIPMIGLAKRFETIIKPAEDGFREILLPESSYAIKLLQRIRDESHRFAVSYHSTLKQKRQIASELEEIPGIGPTTRKKLIKHFGSNKAVKTANEQQIAEVIGAAKAKLVYSHLNG